MRVHSQFPPLVRRALMLVMLGGVLMNPAPAQAQFAGGSLEEAETAFEENRFTEAMRIADQVLKGDPQNHRALFIRASSRVEVGVDTGNEAMVRDGVADSREAIRASESKFAEYYLPYLYGMTNLAVLENRPEHAQASISVATQVYQGLEMSGEDKANILYQRGLAKLQAEESIDPAVEDFNLALDFNGKHMASLTAIADAYAMSGKNEQAMGAYDRFVEIYPKEPIGYNNRGMFHKQLDNKQDAIADFRKAVELAPKFFIAHVNLGFMEMESGQATEAEKVISTAISLQPQNPVVYGLRANARLRQGNSQDAIADYKKAIELYPKNPLAHADLGFAYFFLKQYAEAYEQFDAAININGNLRFLDPWIYASMVLSGQVQDANNRFAGTVAKPKDERDWIDLLTLYLMGKVKEESLLESVNPEDRQAGIAQTCEGHYFIGLRQSNLAGPEVAEPHFKEAIATGASHLSAYRAAQFELNQFVR